MSRGKTRSRAGETAFPQEFTLAADPRAFPGLASGIGGHERCGHFTIPGLPCQLWLVTCS